LVRSADILTMAPASPRLPSSSSPFKGGGGKAAQSWTTSAASAPLVEMLPMLDLPPPPSAKVVGLSTGAKIGIGLGAGALLLYVMTRK
jgi:hypothetical protein